MCVTNPLSPKIGTVNFRPGREEPHRKEAAEGLKVNGVPGHLFNLLGV